MDTFILLSILLQQLVDIVRRIAGVRLDGNYVIAAAVVLGVVIAFVGDVAVASLQGFDVAPVLDRLITGIMMAVGAGWLNDRLPRRQFDAPRAAGPSTE